MSESRDVSENPFTVIERLFMPEGTHANTSYCWFGGTMNHDSAHVLVRMFSTAGDASVVFARDGRHFVAPRAYTEPRRADGGYDGLTLAPIDPPIPSTETIPELADENRLWRGYGSNKRGVIKLRVGRFVAELNAPTVDNAQSLATRLVTVLRA